MRTPINDFTELNVGVVNEITICLRRNSSINAMEARSQVYIEDRWTKLHSLATPIGGLMNTMLNRAT